LLLRLEKERSRDFLYFSSHDKPFEKKNIRKKYRKNEIEKDEIKKNEKLKKMKFKMNQIKKEIIHLGYAIKMMK
jgi:hypothetical protein